MHQDFQVSGRGLAWLYYYLSRNIGGKHINMLNQFSAYFSHLCWLKAGTELTPSFINMMNMLGYMKPRVYCTLYEITAFNWLWNCLRSLPNIQVRVIGLLRGSNRCSVCNPSDSCSARELVYLFSPFVISFSPMTSVFQSWILIVW